MSTEQTTIKVIGMSCGGCENAVSRALKAVPGVVSARASHTESLAWVEYDPGKATVLALKQAITQAGYNIT